MNKTVIGGLIALTFSINAFAAYYQTECDSCGINGPAPGPTWVAAAVSFAQAHSVNVGDTLVVCKTRPNNSSYWDIFTINSAPVQDGSDLTFEGTGGDPDYPC